MAVTWRRPKRASFYRFVESPNPDFWDVQKWSVVALEGFRKESTYEVGKAGTACSCPARKFPCRHIKMVPFFLTMGCPRDTYILYNEGEEPRHFSHADILDIWDVPEGD